MSPEENQKANQLCMISLICELVPIFANPILSVLTIRNRGFGNILNNVMSSLGGIMMLAGIVIMIVVRVKYPQNTFGKVLMWIYIVVAVVLLILFITVMVICAIACNEMASGCGSCLNDCSRMGFLYWPW